MSGEMRAVLKIVEGVKELGKALLPDEAEVKRPPEPDPWAAATQPPPPMPREGGIYAIPTSLLDELRAAWEDDDIMKHVPMGMARPVVRVLSHVYPEIT